jgi:hypothetical protein
LFLIPFKHMRVFLEMQSLFLRNRRVFLDCYMEGDTVTAASGVSPASVPGANTTVPGAGVGVSTPRKRTSTTPSPESTPKTPRKLRTPPTPVSHACCHCGQVSIVFAIIRGFFYLILYLKYADYRCGTTRLSATSTNGQKCASTEKPRRPRRC